MKNMTTNWIKGHMARAEAHIKEYGSKCSTCGDPIRLADNIDSIKECCVELTNRGELVP